jgi:D-galactonate transporter
MTDFVIDIARERIDPLSAEDRVFAKIIWRLMPLIFVAYSLAYLDRINVGYAQLQMKTALSFSDAVYGLGAGLFFLSYLTLEIPSNMLFARFGARATITRIMVLWGAASTAMMFVQTPVQFYVLRFLLGAFEAGLFPGILLYLTYWFPSARRGKATGLFLFALPVAGVLGGPLSGWIMTHLAGVGGLDGWQWLFLLQGLPSVAYGAVWYAFAANSPNQAKWLNTEEKSIVSRAFADDAEHPHHDGLREAFANPRVYILGLIFFTNFCGVYTFSFWLPTIIKSLGVSDLSTVGWLSLIPYAFGALGMLLIGLSSDRLRERRLHIAVPTLVGAAALSASMVIGSSLTLSIVLLCVAAFGILGSASAFWAAPPTYLTGKARPAGIALVSAIGAFGGFISPTLIGYVKTMTGSLNDGLYFMTVLLCVGAILALAALPSEMMRVGRGKP